MAKERTIFLLSFLVLGLFAAFLFRHSDKEISIPLPPKVAIPDKPLIEFTKTTPSGVQAAPGKMAIPFLLTSRSAILQFMEPGKSVDIIFTAKPEFGLGTIALTILRNIRILNIGRDAEGNRFNEKDCFYKPNTPIEVLLEMTPRQSEIFSYAEQAGALSFAIKEKDFPEKNDELINKLLESNSDVNFKSILVTHKIRSLFHQSDIEVTAVPQGYILEGKAANAAEGEKIVKTLEMLSSGETKTVINLLQEDPTQSAESAIEVLVAQRDLKQGDSLKIEDYTWKKIRPADFHPSWIAKTPSENWLNDAVVSNLVQNGSKINASDLVWPKESDSAEVNPGFEVAAGKMVVPYILSPRSLIVQSLNAGESVDIKFTSKLDIGISTESLTLLKNIPILALKDSSGKSVSGISGFYQGSEIEVFLEMTPKQAEIFSFAEASGVISLERYQADRLHEKNELAEKLLQSESSRNFHSVLITHMIRTLFPLVDVKITSSSKGYVVEGNVPDPQMAAKILEIINKLVPDGDKALVNLMAVEPQQVLLRVKVLEVDKNKKMNLGLNWRVLYQKDRSAFGLSAVYPSPGVADPNYAFSGSRRTTHFNITALIDMLQTDANAKLLAEPNLTTISGETAHFFSGGEFPILIPQTGASAGTFTGTVTVEYKKFGVVLDFTPVVDLNGLITLHVTPEVSNLDKSNSVTISGFVIPALVSRRVETTVKLWPGQSYLIAGLFLDDSVEENTNLWGLNRIPLIGPLFNSKTKITEKKELIVIVTPSLISKESKEGQVEGFSDSDNTLENAFNRDQCKTLSDLNHTQSHALPVERHQKNEIPAFHAEQKAQINPTTIESENHSPIPQEKSLISESEPMITLPQTFDSAREKRGEGEEEENQKSAELPKPTSDLSTQAVIPSQKHSSIETGPSSSKVYTEKSQAQSNGQSVPDRYKKEDFRFKAPLTPQKNQPVALLEREIENKQEKRKRESIASNRRTSVSSHPPTPEKVGRSSSALYKKQGNARTVPPVVSKSVVQNNTTSDVPKKKSVVRIKKYVQVPYKQEFERNRNARVRRKEATTKKCPFEELEAVQEKPFSQVPSSQ